MNISEWFLFGALAALVIWGLMSIPYRPAYKEHEDQKAQEDEAQGVVDSMKGQLEYMRKDGLL